MIYSRIPVSGNDQLSDLELFEDPDSWENILHYTLESPAKPDWGYPSYHYVFLKSDSLHCQLFIPQLVVEEITRPLSLLVDH